MDQEQLVTAFRGQDPEALQELVKAYGDRLLRSAFLLCGNQTEAQDIVQDTFVQAIGSAPRFRGNSSIYTWLHAILLNVTRHYHRTRKRIVYNDELASTDLCPLEENPSNPDLETISCAVGDALRKLSPSHREVLVLRYYENMKIREIAAHLGISRGTVKSRLHYATREMQNWVPAEMNLFASSGTKQKEST